MTFYWNNNNDNSINNLRDNVCLVETRLMKYSREIRVGHKTRDYLNCFQRQIWGLDMKWSDFNNVIFILFQIEIYTLDYILSERVNSREINYLGCNLLLIYMTED